MSAAFATAELAGTRKWRKPPFIESTLLRRGLLLLAIVYLIAAFASLDVNWERVYLGLERGWKFIVAFSRPDFISRWTDMRDGMIESIIMTVASTVVGVLISIPIGLGAARNIAPLPIYLICRAIVALSRALHEIIIAILMVAIFGFGPLAGFITLSFATIGFYRSFWPKTLNRWIRRRPRRSRRPADRGFSGSITACSRRSCRG